MDEQRGFNLLELLIAVVIIGVMIALVCPQPM